MYIANDTAGWGDYPDSGVAMGQLIGQLSGLDYQPDLSDVGHGAAYNPGSITADSRALNFLGFLPDAIMASLPDSFGQGGQKDLAAGVGAFHPDFKTAVRDFQSISGVSPVDGFIGPITRSALKRAVDAKNASQPVAPAAPVSPGAPGASPASPGTAVSSGGMSTGVMAAIALAVVGAGYAAYKYLT